MAPRSKLVKSSGSRPDADIDVDDFITLLYAAGSRLFSLRRTVAKSIGLNTPEFAAVLAVARLDEGEGVRIKALADDVHVAATNMTTTVNALLARGWVHKLTDQEDSRAVRISLTEAARFRLNTLAKKITEINEQWFGEETSDELIRHSCQVLSALVRNYERAQAVVNGLDFTGLFPADSEISDTRIT